MLSLHHVSKSFGDKIILVDASLSLNVGEIASLLGDNGVGKTTLLKIITGEITPDSGQVINDHEIIGYLPQAPVFGDTILQSFDDTTPTWQIERALEMVGLKEKGLGTEVDNLSGGQKTRLALANVLALDHQPTLLLLDEPTNNIDVEGRNWLMELILTFPGGVLLVSHDRKFINEITTKVIELDGGKLTQYGGNYDFYRSQKQNERQADVKHYEESLALKKRLEKIRQDKIGFISQTGAESFDKIKHESKVMFNTKKNATEKNLGKQIGAIDSRINQLEEIDRPEKIANYSLSIDGQLPKTKLIVRAEGIGGAFGLPLFKDLNFEIRGSERVQIVGQNGSGKTTLLKIVAGILKPTDGEITIGVGVKIGYYSQEVSGINEAFNGLDNLRVITANRTAIYSLAKVLGLGIEDLAKKPAQMSRGQVAKLAFTKMLLNKNTFLILDEPTNHLDIKSRERIEAALQDYKGAILVASHDEYFLDQIGATRQVDLAKYRPNP